MVALRLIHVARLTLDHRHTKSTHARNRHALRSIETFAMAKRGSAAERLPIEPPSLDTQDASALRTFIESMISAGAITALVSWLLALLTRLWKTQNDLLERVRSRKRRNGDNEKLARLQALLPGIDWSTPVNDTAAAPEGKPKDKDKRKRVKSEGMRAGGSPRRTRW